MRYKLKATLSIILSVVILICSSSVTIIASDLVQGENQESTLIEVTKESKSIPNAVTAIVKKVDKNRVRVFFSNVGVDTVDSATATLILVQSNGIPLAYPYTVTALKPFINQSFTYYSANWISAQLVNVVAVDGGKTGTLDNSPVIYND